MANFYYINGWSDVWRDKIANFFCYYGTHAVQSISTDNQSYFRFKKFEKFGKFYLLEVFWISDLYFVISIIILTKLPKYSCHKERF